MTGQSESLPFHEDIEQGLICSMMRNAEIIDECRSLPEEAFYIPKFQLLFRTLKNFRDSRQPIDFHFLKKHLGDSGQLQEVGGVEGLNETWEFVPSWVLWRDYLAKVKDEYRRRSVILACHKLEGQMRDRTLESGASIREVAEETLTRLAISTMQRPKTMKDVMLDVCARIEERKENPGISGITFGLVGLDRIIGGVQPGEVVTVGAETSGGKSAFAMQTIVSAAKQGKPSAVFSLEMSARDLGLRMIANEGQKISVRQMRNPEGLTDAQIRDVQRTATQLANLPIYFDDDFDFDVDTMVSRCRQLKAKHNLELVIIDYLQLVRGPIRRRDATREREVAEVSRRLKEMARELNLVVLSLSQLNDDGLLRESRAIGQDSTIVLIVKTFNASRDEEKTIEIAKHRDGPGREKITVHFNGPFVRFEEAKTNRKEGSESFSPAGTRH
jgi:replicative DNA helicase